ncbi:MAG: ATP-binding protein [Oculatellaceae cyanobacterium Prado106]|nr:ATP-binding protein [Oculatellaceae cyanobacterium Prado106]
MSPLPSTEDLQKQLDRFRAANQNLRLQPLKTSDELNRFWVEHDPDLLDELEQTVKSSLETEKHLLTGHTGCGKSTLLAELRYRLEPDYFVVLFSVSDLVEMADINHVTILFSVATQLLEAAEEKEISIPPSTRLQLYRWLGKHTQVDTRQVEESFEVGYEAGGGISGAIAKFWAAVKSTLKINAVIRDEITVTFERQISELVSQINFIASVIAAESDRPLLVIIDDLDKLNLDLATKVYGNNIQPLSQPSFRILYTIPIFILRDVRLRKILEANTARIQIMRVGKFFAKGDSHQPHPTPVNLELVESFEQILNRRLPPDLIDEAVRQMLVLKSGGVLREMVRIASRCCDKCMVQLGRSLRSGAKIPSALPKIDAAILQQALTDFQIEYDEPLGQKDYELLKGIYQEGKPQDAEDQRFLDLLHGLHILEYRNAKLWYDLNPIVLDLLRQEGVLSEPHE